MARVEAWASSATNVFLVIPRWESNARVRRVSSAYTRGTLFSVSMARSVTSDRLPIGVPTMKSVANGDSD